MYALDIKPEADKIFKKLSKKNLRQLKIIYNKIKKIQLGPHHKYKFLKKPLQLFNRVHIDKHFVLIFKIHHKKEVVKIYHYDNHDQVYQWHPALPT